MEAVIFIGGQASGKSTFYARTFSGTHVRINLDMLKTRHRESTLLKTCIDMNQPFVVDNTNPTSEDRTKYIEAAKAAGFVIKAYYFQSKIDELLRRNESRPETQRIPDAGIRGTHRKIELPSYEEGIDELYYVQIDEDGGFIVDEWKNEI